MFKLTDTNYFRQYSSDEYGNLSLTQNSGVPLSGLTPFNNGSSPYNTSNNRLLSANYDGRGNITGLGAVSMNYDAEGNMKSTADSGTGQSINWIYDAEGQRVQKQVAGGATVVYVHDAYGQLAAEYNSAGVTPNCVTCYLTYDMIGTPRLITNERQNVVTRHDYIPFGEEIFDGTAGRSGNFGYSSGVTQGFTGQEADGGTAQLDFFNARHLSGVLGSFVQPDPANAGANVMRPQSWNAYAYVLGNPLGNVDPSGRECIYFDNGTSGDDGQGQTCLGANDPDIVNVYSGGSAYAVSFGYFGYQNQSGSSGSGSSGQQQTQAPPQTSNAQPVQRDPVHVAACSVAGTIGPLAAAQITKKVAGIGVIGSAGAGLLFGGGASLGIQLVADPKGNVGLSFSGSWSSILFGASAMIGAQATITNATSIQDLNGPSGGLDFSFGAGPAIDLGVQSNSTPNWQKLVGPLSGSVTAGLGVGTRMTALSLGASYVLPLANCGTH